MADNTQSDDLRGETIRTALVPGVPHMSPYVSVPMLVASLIVFSTIGLKGFMRRAID